MKDKKENIQEEMVEELKETTKKGPTKSEKLQAEIDALKAEIEELRAAIAEKDDKYLRMAAEYDNFRRRSREEKEGIWEAAMSETVAELLPIIDNIERAAAFEGGDKVREGLEMIAKTTSGVFEKLGVEALGVVGETFDPNLHNAVLHVDDESFGDGEIVEVFQKGYKKGKRIIRFAMVKTAN